MPDSTPSKLTRSWLLFSTSLHVVRQNKRLLLFPVVTSACSLVMLLFFLSPALLYPTGHTLGEPAHWQNIGNLFGLQLAGSETDFHPTAWFYGYAATLYLVSMFLATFFNTAFYNEIMKALAGESVSIRAGLRFAWSRVRSILMWSLFAGAVGLLIKALEERFGWVGRWVMRFIGVVWSVASVFAIPVIVREGTHNPLALLRNSAGILRKTWGESLIGYAGVTIGSWIVLLASLAFLGGMGVISIALHTPLVILAAIVLWLVAMLILAYLASIAGDVYRCALYVYASEGVVPTPYNAELLDAAWKIKKC